MKGAKLGLPCSPNLLCIDRFDLTDSDADEVPFWRILQAALAAPLTDLIGLLSLLETIAVTRRGTAGTSYELLRLSFAKYWTSQERFFQSIWPALKSVALELPFLFPSGLHVLTTTNSNMVLSRRQVASLVVHQFLCTLDTPPWMTDGCPDFRIWYNSQTPHPKAVEAYLFALFRYFEMLASTDNPILTSNDLGWPITFTLRKMDAEYLTTEMCSRRLTGFETTSKEEHTLVEDEDSLLGLPHGATVISANKDVGFGRTASQEEMVVGASPELCVVVLLTPTLQDDEVLVVQGAQPMICMAGYGRDANLTKIIELDRPGFMTSIPSRCRERTVLFIDALELDSFDTRELTPDLLPGNVDRELRKAYTAFSFARNRDGQAFEVVITGLWGCRSFGGNRQIKTIIQWLAASLAGTKLRFVCSSKDQEDFATELRFFVAECSGHDWTVGHLLRELRDLRPEDDDARHAFRAILARCGLRRSP